MTRKKVDAFWKIMSEVLPKVLLDAESDGLVKQIDDLVNDLGDYDWEYGPSKKTEFYFCLSPNFQEDLIEEVDEIISFAPKLNGWEYISCKPRKEQIRSWNMLNENNQEITVDTHNWKCVVYKFPDNTIDLDIKIDHVEGNLDIQNLAVDIHLTNVLGERNFIKIIKQINLVSEFTEKDRQRAISTRDLFAVIAKNIPGSNIESVS